MFSTTYMMYTQMCATKSTSVEDRMRWLGWNVTVHIQIRLGLSLREVSKQQLRVQFVDCRTFQHSLQAFPENNRLGIGCWKILSQADRLRE